MLTRAQEAPRTGWARDTASGLTFYIAVGLCVLGIVFHQEVIAAVRTWMTSTAYNHCFLVIPIALYLWRDRLPEIAAIAPQPSPASCLLGVPIAIAWFVAERLGIMEGRQLAAISFVELLFYMLLGRTLWRAMSGPLLYLYFLVPFGAFLTPMLQDVTTAFVRYGLRFLDVPAYIDGYVIDISEGRFLVAEACAGLRFLIASVAFGCLYGLLTYRSYLKRSLFVAVSIIAPIIANGVRAIGIVYLGHVLGSAQAAAADHVIYGWLFFSIVLLLLIACGLPFRDDVAARPVRPMLCRPAQPARQKLLTAVLTLSVAATIMPAVALAVSYAASDTAENDFIISTGQGCRQQSLGGQRARLACDDAAMILTWQSLPAHVTAAPVLAAQQRLCAQAETETTSRAWLNAGSDWLILSSGHPAFLLATALWIDGHPARPGLALRLRLAISSLFGSRYAPLVMTVTPDMNWNQVTPAAQVAAAGALRGFLQHHPALVSFR